MRIAAFDVGTNTVLSSVVDRADASYELIAERALITRLGEGVDATGSLDPRAIERTLEALASLAVQARADGATRLVGVGTSALRDAVNREAFVLPARAILDRFDVVDGRREAALTLRGAFFGLAAPDGAVTVVDIGGGSTEIVRGTGARMERATSLDVGSVRLFERHLSGGDRPNAPAPDAAAIARVRADVDRALFGCEIAPPLVVLAGTATNVAAVAFGRDVANGAPIPHGEVLSSAALLSAVSRIVSASHEERRAMIGIEPGREDVIVAGAILLERVLLRAQVDEILVSDGGVRLGLAIEDFEASDRRQPEPC